jgi:hypothetical protein
VRSGGSSPSPTHRGSLEGLGPGAVAVEAAAVIGVHEDVGAALQFGVDAARRLELDGAGPGDGRAVDIVARKVVASARGLGWRDVENNDLHAGALR